MTYIKETDLFYHIYPLGALGAPRTNDHASLPAPRLRELTPWLDHAAGLGATAIYLGPVFESSTHGYDTADFFWVDRRLGTNADLAAFAAAAREHGIKLVLDAVFNHVGRNFWAFQDLLANGEASPYRDWFSGLRFDACSPYNDPFCYDCWQGHAGLVKLNLANPAVRQHIFEAIRFWHKEFGISGLRLDAADALSLAFIRELRSFTNGLDPQLWLMGELIHGDYRDWVNPEMLHSATNYELFKSSWSALNDGNFFELAYSLNRQFGQGGIYTGLGLYSFLDNHDVSRIATQLNDPAQLWMLYTLLFTVPGIPAVYYGSEFGLEGRKDQDDWKLRPAIQPDQLLAQPPYPERASLPAHISRLAEIRRGHPALSRGNYRQLSVGPRQFAFLREGAGQSMIVALNSAAEAADLTLNLPDIPGSSWRSLLHPGETFQAGPGGQLQLRLYPRGAAILLRE